MLKRRSLSILVLACLLGTVTTSARAAGPSSPQAGTPAAANLPEVTMICASSQVDINHAAAAEMASRFGLDGSVAQRIVGFRPYLAPRDLLVVEGIGPEKLASILASGQACATPVSEPPTAAEHCVDARVDLQAASVSELVKALKISKPVAERLVAARPFAVKRHVTPERVAGVGKGTLQDIVARTCLTPAPIRTSTASYRWAYASQSTTVTRDGFSLLVPSGRVMGDGAWLSIAPGVPDPEPWAEFLIHGSWTGAVKVGMPALDPDLAFVGSDEPTVLHAPFDGDGADRLWASDSIDVSNDSLYFWTATLSPYMSALRDGDQFQVYETSGSSGVDPHRQAQLELEELWSEDFAEATASPFPGCPDSDRLRTSGIIYRAIECVSATRTGDTAVWTIANRTEAAALVYREGAVRFGDAAYGGANALMSRVVRGYNDNSDGSTENAFTLLPGGTLEITLQTGTSGTVRFGNAIVETGLLSALSEVTGLLVLGGVNVDSVVDCFVDLFVSSRTDLLSALPDLSTMIQCAIDVATDLNADRPSVSDRIKTLGRFVKIFFYAGVISDALGFSDSYMDFRHVAPAPPVPGSGGGGGISLPNGGLDGTIPPGEITGIIIDPGNHAMLTHLGSKVGYHIFPEDYGCLARRYLKIDWAGDRLLTYATSESVDPAECVESVPQITIPEGSRNFILRESNGTAWFLDVDSEFRWIPDEATYICLAQTYFVADHRTWQEISAFPYDAQDQHMTCA